MRNWITLFAAALFVFVAADHVFAQAAPSQGDALKAYRINPGDDLDIFVWGEDRLQRSVKVLPDGSFAYPLVGQVQAAGKLPTEIEAEITRGLRSQYRDQVPQVTVAVKATSGLMIYVIGKVRNPGVLLPSRYINPLEAIAMAGGPDTFADLNGVAVMRKQGGRVNVTRLRLGDAMKGNPNPAEIANLPQLQSGDSVIVP